MTTKRAAAYTRVANSENASERLADQERQIRQWAQRNGCEVVDVYTDIGSGNNDQRPGLEQLSADARAGAFELVIVTELSRLFRNMLLLHLYCNLLRNQMGVAVSAVHPCDGCQYEGWPR
jgi:DNA invertase Pin-like site-specific DNA recombinase